MVKSLWWRLWVCPGTEQAAAVDFLYCRNPPDVQLNLAAGAHLIDFTRRIAYIYGLGWVTRVDKDTGRDIWSVGWNRRLINVGGESADPQAVAERILGLVREMARSLPLGVGTEAEQNVARVRGPSPS